ncbi:MAG: AbrB/MazE/SpoVT family DNA-binding domain-containing protein [Candidatus Margulisbacteria bacterium]|nr:AbrB/MazE/SpoVT family DNA-binding domain-containing protein [Candidatus Margulisiibacteriota bacterium]
MTEKIKQNNALKIPDLILKRVGLQVGDYVEVTDDGYKIVITPMTTERSFTDKEWDKIEKIAKKKKGKTFKTGEALLKHLDNISHK